MKNDDIKKEFKSHSECINKLMKEISKTNRAKASKDELQALTLRLDQFSELEHINYL